MTDTNALERIEKAMEAGAMSGYTFRRIGSLLVALPVVGTAYMAHINGAEWLAWVCVAMAAWRTHDFMQRRVCPECEKDLLYCVGEWAGVKDYKCPTCGYCWMEEDPR